MHLSYALFWQSQTTEVWPELPLLSDLLYENPYAGQLWIVFNTKKQFMFAGDAYSKHYTSKLDKGDYILKLQVQMHLCCMFMVNHSHLYEL